MSEEAGLTVVDHSTIFVAAKPVKRKLREPIPNAMSKFEKIEQLVGDYQQVGNPVMSMDTKKGVNRSTLSGRAHLYTRDN